MAKKTSVELIDVNWENVSKAGFFCRMSKGESVGNQRKLRWLKDRFAEGMRIKIIKKGGRGFIEYIPGEYAWRPVEAKDYMFIHCLWVVGKSKNKGLGSILLEECILDAKKSGMKGVAMVTSEGHWLAGRALLENHGFESVGEAPPSFNLMVRKFGKARAPSFSDGWDTRLKRFGKGLTIVRSDQCPYVEDVTKTFLKMAEELGIRGRVVELRTLKAVRERSPTPYGVFGIVYDGRLVGYHWLTKNEFTKRLNEVRK